MVRAVMGLVAGALLAASAAAMGPDDPFTPPGRVRLQANGAALRLPTALTGVRLGPAPAALIDGEWVAQGAPVRGARLLRVQRKGAELRHADGRIEWLALFSLDNPPPAADPAASDPAEATLRDTP
jgi:hypothetical protein